MKSFILENMSEEKFNLLSSRFDELKKLDLTDEEMVDNVLDDFDYGMFTEEEVYEVFEDWKSNKNEREEN